MEFANMNVKKLGVVFDGSLAELPVMKTVLKSLHTNKISFDVYNDVLIEPTDSSFKHAIDWAKQGHFDAYLAIGKELVFNHHSEDKLANRVIFFPILRRLFY